MTWSVFESSQKTELWWIDYSEGWETPPPKKKNKQSDEDHFKEENDLFEV